MSYNGEVTESEVANRALEAEKTNGIAEPRGFVESQSGRRTLLEVFVVLALLVGALFALRGGVGFLADRAARYLPSSADAAIGEAAAKSFSAQHAALEDAAAVERVKRIFDELVASLDAEERAKLGALELQVLDNDDVNAFALPGGKVFVLSGLIERSQGDDEIIRGVLAHELGHAVLRHGVRAMARGSAVSVAFASVFGGGDELLGWFIAGAAQLTSLEYSRDMESEADAFAVALLARSGRDAEGLARFLDDLASQPVPEMLSTHPDPLGRSKAIRAGKP